MRRDGLKKKQGWIKGTQEQAGNKQKLKSRLGPRSMGVPRGEGLSQPGEKIPMHLPYLETSLNSDFVRMGMGRIEGLKRKKKARRLLPL